MALSYFNVKSGKKGRGLSHALYILRTDGHAPRRHAGERLLAAESGNLPAWAHNDPVKFWSAADELERANGAAYREFELALPRELSDEQNLALVHAFIKEKLGEKYVWSMGLHIPEAIDGGPQPHAHLMFSERQLDGLERDRETFFKRANSKNPERGGCRKGFGPNNGQGTPKERRAALKALRMEWGETVNAALAAADSTARIDMRSYKERGIDRKPQRKLLPSESNARKAVKKMNRRKKDGTLRKEETRTHTRPAASKEASSANSNRAAVAARKEAGRTRAAASQPKQGAVSRNGATPAGNPRVSERNKTDARSPQRDAYPTRTGRRPASGNPRPARANRQPFATTTRRRAAELRLSRLNVRGLMAVMMRECAMFPVSVDAGNRSLRLALRDALAEPEFNNLRDCVEHENLARVVDFGPKPPVPTANILPAWALLGSGAKVSDYGDRLTLSGHQTPQALKEGAALMAKIASENGWSAVVVSGTRAFKKEVAIACACQSPPLPVQGYKLTQEDLEEIERRKNGGKRPSQSLVSGLNFS